MEIHTGFTPNWFNVKSRISSMEYLAFERKFVTTKLSERPAGDVDWLESRAEDQDSRANRGEKSGNMRNNLGICKLFPRVSSLLVRTQ